MALAAYMPAAACAKPAEPGNRRTAPLGRRRTPFDRQGMWIWYVDHSEGGSLAAIIARAKRDGIGTVYIKSGDGGSYWSQFSSGLVEAAAPRRARRLRLAVRLRRQPGGRGQGRRRRGRSAAPTAW